MGKKEGKRTSGRRCRGEREIAGKSRRQSGEEDEVQPEIWIRKTQTEPRPFGRPRTHVTRSPNTWPSPASRPITARPVTRVRPETRERPVNPRLDPRCLHTRRTLIVPRVTSAARLLSAQAASSARSGLFGSGNLFPTRLTPFRPSRTLFRSYLRNQPPTKA